MDLENIIFDKKTFSSLLKDIYKNSKEKDAKIKDLIKDVQEMMKSPGDVALLIPVMKEYLEIGIKNDDSLIKLASVIQKAFTNASKSEGDNFYLTEEEKKELFNDIKKIDLT